MADTTTFQDPPAMPPSTFDPVNNAADAAKLEQYWLPSRPDARKQPELYEHWKEMLSGPITFVRAKVRPVNAGQPRSSARRPGKADGSAAHLNGSPAGLPADGGPFISSNWSGAFLQASGGRSFSRVAAAWKVPSIKAGVRSALEPPGVPFRCSTWIGIDGRDGTDSMPQLGTVHKLTAEGRQEHGLWWQWWRRGYSKPDGLPHDVTGVSIDVGDRVMCSLVALARDVMRMHFVNRTKGLFATLQVKGAAPIKGFTAEWICERPADFTRAQSPADPGPLHPLPDFGTVAMDKCIADIGTLPVPSWSPQFIELVQQFSNPDRKPVICRPSDVGDRGTLRFTYIPLDPPHP
jgi:hypothetical protein